MRQGNLDVGRGWYSYSLAGMVRIWFAALVSVATSAAWIAPISAPRRPGAAIKEAWNCFSASPGRVLAELGHSDFKPSHSTS
jgi:hypothetical protein